MVDGGGIFGKGNTGVGMGSVRWDKLLDASRSFILAVLSQLVGIWLKGHCRQDELCSLCRVARPSEGDDPESVCQAFPLRSAQNRDDCGNSLPSPALRFTSVLPCRWAWAPPNDRRCVDGRTLRAHLEFLLTLSGNNLTSIGPQFSRPVSPRRSSEATSSARPSLVSERRPSSP